MRTLALALAFAALACGSPEPEPAASVPAPAPEADSAESSRRQPIHLARLDAPEPSRFPHEAHGEFDCTRCHAAVPGHDGHSTVACRDCHEPPAAPANAPRADCDGCHHVETQAYGCLHCHDRRPSEPAPRTVAVQVRAAGNAAAPARPLPFAHERHGRFDCARCHASGSAAAVVVECTSCHGEHHRPEARCSSCHSPPAAAVHPSAQVHRGCAGSGCHTDATVLALPLTRSVCLSCHEAQAQHEPGGDCAGCHGLARRVAGAPGRDP